ncbi:hypothetical protein [Paenibacillus peoriae]|uniref:hypothetical protein n=1 Tax=Paenibacillus peoriae TaxID=59893 RepID=UPI00215AFC37|nr:hypothetical protein [Paenibacillus peoriae]
MGKKGHFGVSMGAIIKRRPKIDASEVNCTNCKFMYKVICKKLNEISKGQMKYVSDKRTAKKCKFYSNGRDLSLKKDLRRRKSNKSSNKKAGKAVKPVAVSKPE